MAIGLKQIWEHGKAVAKLASDEQSLDALAEMLSQMGMEASFLPVGPGDRRGEFEALWLSAAEMGAQVLKVEIVKGPERFSGLLVLTHNNKV
jgi:hypothetical protein